MDRRAWCAIDSPWCCKESDTTWWLSILAFTAVSSAPGTNSSISKCSTNIYCLNKWPPNRALLPLLPPVVCLHRIQSNPCRMWIWSFYCVGQKVCSDFFIGHCGKPEQTFCPAQYFSALSLLLYPPGLTVNLKPLPDQKGTTWSDPSLPLLYHCLSLSPSLQLSSDAGLPVIPQTHKTSIYPGMSFHITHFLTSSSAPLRCSLLSKAFLSSFIW